MRKPVSNKSGFTFVESLITFSIVGIFLALTWATVNFLMLKTGEQIVRTRGHFLAVEGIERIKQIQKTAVNKNREKGFQSSIGNKNGNYVLEENGDAFALESGKNEQIEMTEEPYTVYCRTVNFKGSEDYVKLVSVEVRWGDAEDCSKGNEIISYSTYLAKINQ
jgi:hypothetical protein